MVNGMLMSPGARPHTSVWLMERVPVMVRSSNLSVSTTGAQLPSGHCMPSFLGVTHCHTPPDRVASPPVRPDDGDMCSRHATGKFSGSRRSPTTGTQDGQISYVPLSPCSGVYS